MNNSGQIGKQILHVCASMECQLKTSIKLIDCDQKIYRK